jgi:hypothetical protein
MLEALQEMYEEVRISVRVQGVIGGREVEARRGVKQGDPLSPLLFGLLIYRIKRVLEERLPGVGVLVKGKRLLDLIYADDLTLMMVANMGGAQDVQWA